MLIGLLAHRLIMFHVKRETVTLVVGAILAVVTRPIDPIGNLSFLDATEHSVGLLDAIGAAGDPSLSFVPDSTAHAMRNSARNSSARARPGASMVGHQRAWASLDIFPLHKPTSNRLRTLLSTAASKRLLPNLPMVPNPNLATAAAHS